MQSSESGLQVSQAVEAEVCGFRVVSNGEGRLVLAIAPQHLAEAAALGCAIGQRVALAALRSEQGDSEWMDTP